VAIVLVVAAASAPAGAAGAQVVAPRAVGADLAVAPDGRAFLVSPSARPRAVARAARIRAALPGARFGPSRALMRTSAGDRVVDAGVAADGSGLIVVQRVRVGHRGVRVVAFGPRGRLGAPIALSGARADFAASAVAPSGAAVVVWFRHRAAGRWRLEAAARAPGAARFGAPEPLTAFARRPCCTSVSVAIGERGDAVATWTSTPRPSVWAALRHAGHGFGRPRRLTADASDLPRAFVGAGGAAAVIYSTQHVPLRAQDGLQLHRATSAGAFGPAAHVNPGGGVTIADAAVTAAGAVLVAWRDQVHGARVHVSEARPGRPPVITAELGADVGAKRIAVAGDDAGRAVVAWSQRAPGATVYRERAMAAVRPAPGAPFGPGIALGAPWRAVEPGPARLVPGGGALVAWNGANDGRPSRRRAALLVTRLA
jgi:hypothetical protein